MRGKGEKSYTVFTAFSMVMETTQQDSLEDLG